MGTNFKKRTKGIVGEIIYPAYNGTNGFWTRSRWDLVMEVDNEGNILDVRYIWDFATAEAIELMQELKKR